MKPIEPDPIEPLPDDELDDRAYVTTFYEAVRIEDALGEPPSISEAELEEFLRALGLSPESIGRRSIRKSAPKSRFQNGRSALSRKTDAPSISRHERRPTANQKTPKESL